MGPVVKRTNDPAEELTFSRVSEALDHVKEWLEIGSNELSRLIDGYPAPAPEAGFQPIIKDDGHVHQVDLDLITFIGPLVAIAAKGLAFQIANQARFLLSFSDRGLPRSLAFIEGTFRYNPLPAARRGDEGDFDTVFPNPKGDHCCLTIQSFRFHRSPLRTPPAFPSIDASAARPLLKKSVPSDVALRLGHLWSKTGIEAAFAS
jgi:hypothetical protein